ncbi:WG repeat-containing protein [Candidatus Xianfuyuplasma coldseepsis]|uniref:WG repeat-containing protein n=1 Tax=Candidatus Xianfuyuplasma coldseepsis TaxID=2782163 RepID=A0A7L7KRW3_9MOLU|nr:WG repeat-containing protein [Xianfuyuplasma coldseepsis]QMS85159.1 WG repeat-containing protein [Xianfuyuplasma coldseepsis]
MKALRYLIIGLLVVTLVACKPNKQQVDNTLDISDLLIIVEKDDQIGLINQQGETIVSLQYDDIRRCGTYYLAQDEHIDILDYQGELVNRIDDASLNGYSTFDCPSATEETSISTIFSYTANNLIGFANLDGIVLISPQYMSGQAYFREYGVARVTNSDGKLGFIDRDGSTIITFDHVNMGHPSSERIVATKDGSFGVYDTSGNLVIPMEYQYITAYNGDIAIASKTIGDQYLYGAIDTAGNIVIPFQYEFLSFATHGNLVLFQEGLKFGYLDFYGNQVLEPNYALPLNFSEAGYAHYFNGSLVSLIKNDGTTVFEFFGQEIYRADSRGEYYVIFNNNTYYVYDNQGNQVLSSDLQINYIYDDLAFFIDEENDTQGFMDMNESILYDGDGIVIPGSNLDYGIYRVQLTDGEDITYRFVNRNGDYINDITYDNAYTITIFGLIPVAQDGLWGFINPEGDIVVPLEYDNIEVGLMIS